MNIFIGSSNIADGAGRQLWNFKDGDAARRPPPPVQGLRLARAALERERRRLLRRPVRPAVADPELRALPQPDDQHERLQPLRGAGRLAPIGRALAARPQLHPELPPEASASTSRSRWTCSTSSTSRPGTTSSRRSTTRPSARRDGTSTRGASRSRPGCSSDAPGGAGGRDAPPQARCPASVSSASSCGLSSLSVCALSPSVVGWLIGPRTAAPSRSARASSRRPAGAPPRCARPGRARPSSTLTCARLKSAIGYSGCEGGTRSSASRASGKRRAAR